jgi:protein-tyrosine-phosphatase
MRVLFVCTGNICRSPFAEVVARALNDRTGIEFASAGTIAIDGNHATPTGVAVAAQLGIDMQRHRATQLTAEVLAGSDIVYAMEQGHVASVLELDPGARVDLLRPDGEAIRDPYGGDRIEYRECYSVIRDAIERRGPVGG